jgi:drug/metabolite transporter (DMT)-like permease
MLNFTPLIVAVLGIVFLNEKLTILKWSGSILFIVGVVFYFYPLTLIGNQTTGLAVMMIGVFAYSGSSILGRHINRNKNISPVIVTFISMGFGAILLLIIGLIRTDIPTISLTNWFYLIWLAVINTALAFTLWNHTLRTVSAIESSIINGTMLIQIAILAWIFIGEKITFFEGIGMAIAVVGAVLVQLKSKIVAS